MFLAASHFILLTFALSLTLSDVARANSITIAFTAMIAFRDRNIIDTNNVFDEGYGANLKGQVIVGSASINPAALTERCTSGGACYGNAGGGAVSVNFTLNGITATVVSTSPFRYFGNSSGGSVLINDRADGSSNYLAVGATSASGMLQQSIGALFNLATLFSAYGYGDPAMAVASLNNIGKGTELVSGGITFHDWRRVSGRKHPHYWYRRCAGTGRLSIVRCRVGQNSHRPPENCGLNQRLPGQVFPGRSFTDS